jgi:hypothetical protein
MDGSYVSVSLDDIEWLSDMELAALPRCVSDALLAEMAQRGWRYSPLRCVWTRGNA